MSYEELWKRLTAVYDEREAKAVAQYVLDVGYGLSFTDVICGGLQRLTPAEQQQLETIAARLEQAEPVQYVLGMADFCGRMFHVEPGVLIPRPETAMLCQWIISEQKGRDTASILDIGTGSGCIACTLAAELPAAAVTAWDISKQALVIARDNARRMGLNVTFCRTDILCDPPIPAEGWSLIVSNPPYIYIKEQSEMARNVLDYEPHEALFAPGDDPLRFYQHISDYAILTLTAGGRLFLEMNPLLTETVAHYLSTHGLNDVEVKKDPYGKLRYIKATKL